MPPAYVDADDDGAMDPDEETRLSQPFIVNGEKFEVVSLDPAGTHIVRRASIVESAVSVGFKAPDLKGAGPAGDVHALRDAKGKVVLLEFWSTRCAFAEAIRPLVNSLAERFRGEDFVVLSMARETDGSSVRTFLEANPKSSVVMLRDEESWTRFNPEGATPLCFLIDRDGVIRHRALGVTAVKALEDLTARLLGRR